MGRCIGNWRKPDPRDPGGMPPGQRAPARLPRTRHGKIAGRATAGNSRRVAHTVRHFGRDPLRNHSRGS
eukprot:7161438-Heterocapsa_arctica.AAC.1